MAYTAGPRFPTTASSSGGSGTGWSNTGNVFVSDATYATGDISGGGYLSGFLKTTGYGFNLPATAVIQGIYVEVQRSGTSARDQNVYLVKGGVQQTTDRSTGTVIPASEAWQGFGGPTDLWGGSWTYADINASNFGVAYQAQNISGGGNVSVDAVRITVYWNYAPADVQKTYIYKVYRNGTYLGDIPNVVSEYGHSQDLNTAGSQITITAALTADTAAIPSTGSLTDESGVTLTDESSNPLLTEGAINYVGTGVGSTLIKNGNQVVVWETSYYWPNGHVIFQGQMQRWDASFGGEGEDDTINILVYSDGADLDNDLIIGGTTTYTTDQQNTSQNTSQTISYNNSTGAWNWYGQSVTVGAGIKNIAQVSILLGGSANGVTINLYDSPAMANLLGTISMNVSGASSALETVFTFANRVTVVPGSTVFFTVTLPLTSTQSITIYEQNTDTYSGGAMYNSNYSGGGGGGSWGVVTGNDLWFRTNYSSDSTTTTYTTTDPTTGMLSSFMATYGSRGGKITVNSGSVQATGLSLTYTFTTNTIYEGVKKVLELAPDGFYYYVDLATDVLNFKQASTTADVLLVKDKNISSLHVIATVENVKNTVYVSGGIPGGSTTNIYKYYQDSSSIALYGRKLDRRSDNRVTLSATADAIGNSAIAELKDEQYQTVVKVLDKTMDISQLHVGQVIGFRGFGTFVDGLLSQIVRIDYTPEEATLTLGVLPRRLVPEFERITRGLLAEQTIANPSTPS